MVLDTIENHALYTGLSENIAKAFAYITNTDLKNTPEGTYEIDDQLFAIVQEYETKDSVDCKIENHAKHIDVQYLITGEEMMGVATHRNQKVVVKNEESDYTFYEAAINPVLVEEGMFAIFFPDDIHQPGIKSNAINKVKKVVVKIKL